MDETPLPTEVPVDALAPDVLRALIEEFVTRDGTDYGAQEVALEQKVENLRRQLARGEARIVFDPESESVNIVVPDEAS
jgi:uncharacterized protein YheU (UPF0270 family)